MSLINSPDLILQHALKNVWCTPDQDRQYMFTPARMSIPRGVKRSIRLGVETFGLPNNSDVFHVYQLGQVDPDLINSIDEILIWRPISRVCRHLNVLIDIYTRNGLQFPRFESWLMMTRDKNVVIAIKHQNTFDVSLERLSEEK